MSRDVHRVQYVTESRFKIRALENSSLIPCIRLADTPESKRLSGLSCSWALLQTVKITVPMETPSDDLEHYGGLGLGRLDLLLAPITKSNVGCSMSLVRCREHDTVGYRVEDVTVAELRKIILTAKGFGKGPLEDCQKCRNKDTTAQHLGHLEDMTGRHACPYPGCHSSTCNVCSRFIIPGAQCFDSSIRPDAQPQVPCPRGAP